MGKDSLCNCPDRGNITFSNNSGSNASSDNLMKQIRNMKIFK